MGHDITQQLAQGFRISEEDIHRARRLHDRCPELFWACWLGYLSLDQAENVLTVTRRKKKER